MNERMKRKMKKKTKKNPLISALIILFSLIFASTAAISAAASQESELQTGYTLSGDGSGGLAGSPASAGASTSTVIIRDGAFQPSTISVPLGSMVVWINQDSVQHSIQSDLQGSFVSGPIMPGGRFSLVFSVPGSYGYHEAGERNMQGVVTVGGTTASVAGSEAGSGGAASPSWTEVPIDSAAVATVAAVAAPATLQPGATASEVAFSGSNPGQNAEGFVFSTIGSATGSGAGFSMSPLNSQASGQAIQASETDLDLQRFSQYYSPASAAPADQITSPTRLELTEEEPQMLYFGSAQKAVSYSQYQSYAASTGSNSLWISGATSWTQYARVPLGSSLRLVAIAPTGGSGDLYEIYPQGGLVKNSFTFYPYNGVEFYADRAGEHQLFFNIGGQPSNVIVIDVVQYQAPLRPSGSGNFAAVIVRSNWLRGYNVYVDGSLAATERSTGGSDGAVRLNVAGDRYHNIAIDGSGFSFSDNKYFRSGYAYQLVV